MFRFCFVILEPSLTPSLTSTRNLTAPEVTNALRPFYFLVHPDLFGKHPKAQHLNEKNLKTLKNYVDTLVIDRKRPNPKDVSFFIKPRSQEEKERAILRSVGIRLKDSSIRGTVVTILKQAGLPTGYVDNITEASSNKPKESFDWFDSDEQVDPARGLVRFSATDTRQPFTSWLNINVVKARIRFAECEPIRLETERLQGEICDKFGMNDILWDCDWDTLNRRGSIEAFNYVATQHPDIQEQLIGRNLVFGKKSGISIRGDIVLYSGEVRTNWLNILKNSQNSYKLLSFLPLYERALSQSLFGIRLVEGSDGTTLVEEYRVRIRKVVTTLSDYKCRNNLLDSLPRDLSDYRMCVESDACSLMLSPEGVFMIPASTPAFLILEFISASLEEASRRMKEYVSLAQEEQHLRTSCLNDLGLIQLDREDSISSSQMIRCCTAVLGRVNQLRHLTHGSHIIVSRYYMVKSDGVICVPWDLRFGDEDEQDKRSEPNIHLALS